MKSIKRFGVLFVTGLLIVGVYGCSGGGENTTTTTTSTTTATATP